MLFFTNSSSSQPSQHDIFHPFHHSIFASVCKSSYPSCSCHTYLHCFHYPTVTIVLLSDDYSTALTLDCYTLCHIQMSDSCIVSKRTLFLKPTSLGLHGHVPPFHNAYQRPCDTAQLSPLLLLPSPHVKRISLND